MFMDDKELLWQKSQKLMVEIMEECCPKYMAWRWQRRAESHTMSESEQKLFLYQAGQEFENELSLYNITHKAQLTAEIYNFWRQKPNQEIDAQAYFIFRLPHYRHLLDLALIRSWSAQEEARDYQSFLDLTRPYLRRFCQGRSLHLLWFDNKLLLFDGLGQALAAEDLGSTGWEVSELLGLSREEDLIQILLNYAPEKVVVHAGLGDMPPFGNMIYDLLGSRLKYCGGCQLCRRYQSPPILISK